MDAINKTDQIEQSFFEGTPANTILYVELSHKANQLLSRQEIFTRLPEDEKYGYINYNDFYERIKTAGGKISYDYQMRLPIDMHKWIEELELEFLLHTNADGLLNLFKKDG